MRPPAAGMLTGLLIAAACAPLPGGQAADWPVTVGWVPETRAGAAAYTAAAPADPAFLPGGAPIGASPAPWLRFCAQDPSGRACRAPPVRAVLTDARRAELDWVQRDVHSRIIQRPDPDSVGDDWRLLADGEAGDCEDIALTKRQELIERGWPAGALRPAICYAWAQPLGGPEVHAVLTVETTQGTFVLGNLSDEVQPWEQSDCRDWIMRQAGGDWHWIDGGETLPLQMIRAF